MSTRKLVVETAKFNILTVHSPDEGAELFRLFPVVNAVLVRHRWAKRRLPT